jgi:outer membrane protein TolC
VQKPTVLILALASLSWSVGPRRAAAQTPPVPAPPAPATQPAAPGSAIALRDAITLSVKQNRTLRAADIDVVIAQANQYGAVGNEDFILDASADFTASKSEPVEGAGGFQNTESYQLSTEAAITKPLFYGGRLGLRVAHDYTSTQGFIELDPDGDEGPMGPTRLDSSTELYTPTVQLTYFMPLLRNFGEGNMRAARRRAAANLDIAVLERENSVANVVNQTVQAYWELAYAAQDLEIRKSSLDLAREQLRITQARLDVGVGAQTDVAAVRQGIAVRESDVLLAELVLAERALDLRQLVGMDISPADINLSAADRLDLKFQQIDLAGSFQAAFDRNPQIATLRARGKAATIEVELAEDQTKPLLDFNARIGPSGTDDSFGGAVERLGKFTDFQAFASLTFQAPIGNHTAEGNRRVAVGQLQRVRVNEEDLKRTVAVSVTRAVNLLRSTEKRFQADTEAVQLAQINLDAEKARFEVGRTTNFEVLRRQDELAQARLRLTRDSADYLKAVAGLQTLTGEILPAYGITVRPQQ